MTALRFLARLPLAAARDWWANFIDPAARWARVTAEEED